MDAERRKQKYLRSHKFTIRITPEEFKYLQKVTNEENIRNCNMSEYIRKNVFHDQSNPEQLRIDLKELVYQIRKIGVNVNQIAARKNAGIQFEGDDRELLNHLIQIEQLLSEVKVQLEEELYGNH